VSLIWVKLNLGAGIDIDDFWEQGLLLMIE
jgi:hypothetical protein